MATIIFDIASKVNQAPDSSGKRIISLNHNELYAFTLEDFTTLTSPPYSDPEGDALEAIKINDLPVIGTLLLSSIPIAANDEITSAQLIAGSFEYQADPGTTEYYKDSVSTFQVSDVGSSIFRLGSESLIFSVAENENQSPTIVGTGEMELEYGETGIFTRAMFTTNTTPPYSDPEGDAALNLKITGLPTLGTILYNSLAVVVDTVVPFEDIDSGLLTYVPDLADTNGDMQGFTFGIADEGSTEFTE